MGNQCAGKVALVTGASRGIGRAIATRLAAEGAAVAICSRPTPGMEHLGTLEGAETALRALGGPVLVAPFDLGDASLDVGSLVDRVEVMRANALGTREGQVRSNVADLDTSAQAPR